MSPKSAAGDTREQILEVTENLLRTRSFNAFSYQDIADRVGIRKASIHYHFPSKEDLGVALVKRLREEGQAWAQGLSARGASPLEKLEAACSINGISLTSKDEEICMYGVLGVEYNTLPPRMQAAVRELQLAQHRWLKSVLREGRKQGLFQADESVTAQAAFISATLQGTMQVARTTQRPEIFASTMRQLRKALVA